MLTEKGFKTAYAMLAEYFGTFTPLRLETDRKLLIKHNVSDEQLLSSVEMIIETRVYSKPPLFAEILDGCIGNADDKAIIALKEAEEAILTYGPYKSVIFKDKVLQATIEAFTDKSWIGFCELVGTEDWKFQEKKFLDLYKAFARQGRKPRSEYLIGICEHSNSKNGIMQEYDIDIVDGKVIVKGLVDRNDMVYLIGYDKNTPKSLPKKVVMTILNEQSQKDKIDNRTKLTSLLSKTVKAVGE